MAQQRHRLAQRRKAVGLSQESLAADLGVDRSTVVRWERGRTDPQPWHRLRLARALRIPVETLADLLADADPAAGSAVRDPGPRPAGTPDPDQLVRDLRAWLLVRGDLGSSADPGVGSGAGVPSPGPRDLAAVDTGVRAAHDAYQRADYTAAARVLPGLVTDAERLVREATGEAHWQAQRVLSAGYLAASKLAAKLGDGVLAWLAADRSVSAALVAGDPLLAAVGGGQVARAMLQTPGRRDDAGQVVDAALVDLARQGGPEYPAHRSVRGTLLLLAAVVAARARRPAEADARLAAAAEAASDFGQEGNVWWTGFGPTNVRIHELSVAVELGRSAHGVEVGKRLDPSGMPPALLSRRAQVHLDLAAALVPTPGGAAAAVRQLLAAERIAPEAVHVGHTARSLLTRLLRHERRGATPGLRQLAGRAGVLA